MYWFPRSAATPNICSRIFSEVAFLFLFIFLFNFYSITELSWANQWKKCSLKPKTSFTQLILQNCVLLEWTISRKSEFLFRMLAYIIGYYKYCCKGNIILDGIFNLVQTKCAKSLFLNFLSLHIFWKIPSDINPPLIKIEDHL